MTDRSPDNPFCICFHRLRYFGVPCRDRVFLQACSHRRKKDKDQTNTQMLLSYGEHPGNASWLFHTYPPTHKSQDPKCHFHHEGHEEDEGKPLRLGLIAIIF